VWDTVKLGRRNRSSQSKESHVQGKFSDALTEAFDSIDFKFIQEERWKEAFATLLLTFFLQGTSV
jgi:hypothetical protein